MSYLLSPALRKKLKKPLGKLLAEPDWEGRFITVGDHTSFLAAKAGKSPLVSVYDNLVGRSETCEEKRVAIEGMPGKKIVVENPAGTITREAEAAIKLALESPPAKVQVHGEEDLLVLPCMAHAPDGTAIYYGQPGEGTVKVTVTPKTREKAKKILFSMEEVKP